MRRITALIVIAGCKLHFEEREPSDGALDAPLLFKIGGVASGVTGELEIALDGVATLVLTSDTSFQFAERLAAGTPYRVSVVRSPPGRSCVVANGVGIVDHDIDDIAVSCFVAGACPTTPLNYSTHDVFTLPLGCSTFTVQARGGGGAGGAKGTNATTPAAGGAGGAAILTFDNEAPGTTYTIRVGGSGACASTAEASGGGGPGGLSGGGGDGGDGGGVLGSQGGSGSGGAQPGGNGGSGAYGGGGGGGGGDTRLGNGGGGATTFGVGTSLFVIAGGGGGAGAADQDGDVAGAGGAACMGYTGQDGGDAMGPRAGGGGGGGSCSCRGGACDVTPSPTGAAGGAAGTTSTCGSAQSGGAGSLTITFP